MATGTTTTNELKDSIPKIIASSRLIQEQPIGMKGLVETINMAEGTGDTWYEVYLNKITAQTVTQLTDLETNPQQLDDGYISVEPGMIGIYILVTQKAKRRLSKNVVSKIGELGQNAIENKIDSDLLSLFSAATISLGAAAAIMNSGYISAGATQIVSNTTEPAGTGSPLYAVLHGNQIHPIYSQLTAGVGTYIVSPGMTQDTFQNGYQGKIKGASIYENGNIPIDSSDDAVGGIFVKKGLLLVREAPTRVFNEFKPGKGGGSDGVYMYAYYGTGERSVGHWLAKLTSDASVPSS